MNFEDLKNSLVRDLKPVKKLLNPRTQALRYLLFSLILVIPLTFLLGLREDLDLRLNNLDYYSELLLIAAIVVVSSISTLTIATPGLNFKPYLALLAVLFSAWINLIFQKSNSIETLLTEAEYSCSRLVVIASIIFGSILVGISYKNFPTHPRLTSFISLLSSSTLGALILHLVCPGESFNHLFIWHLLPVMLIPILGMFVIEFLVKYKK